jgi:hypothetical protein
MDAITKQPNVNTPPSAPNNIKLLAMGLVTITVILIFGLAKYDSNSIMKHTYLYMLPLLLIICMIFIYFINLFDAKTKAYAYSFIMFAAMIIIAIAVSIAIVYHTSIYGFVTNDYFINLILLSMILVGLAAFYFVFLEKYVNSNGWIPFIIKFIFYIPCTFTEMIQYVIKDFYGTQNYIFNLLFIETLLLIVYFYIYPRMHQSVYKNGFILLKNPILLNDYKRIDSELYKLQGTQMPNPITDKITQDSPFRENYSLSMWIYLNVQPFTQLAYSKESTIFAYGSQENSHPKITYKNNTDGLDQYVFYLSPSTKYGVSLPHQKWNNVVLNYRDGYVDLFINGTLESAIKLEDKPVFTKRDTIYVGEKTSEPTGLYGSICNVVYYKNIMTLGQIINNYNLLSVLNPPVN